MARNADFVTNRLLRDQGLRTHHVCNEDSRLEISRLRSNNIRNPEGRIEKRTTDQALAWVLILHYYCHVENGMKMEGVREGSGVYEALLDPDFKLMLVT